MNNSQKLAWISGLLEGEGSFLVIRPGKYKYPAVQICMTDKDVMKKYQLCLHDILNVDIPRLYIHEYKRNKTVYMHHLRGNRALQLMNLLLPFMGERRSIKIKEIINETTV